MKELLQHQKMPVKQLVIQNL